MFKKVIKRVYSGTTRYYTKSHYTVLPSDTFEGKVIPISRIIPKDEPFGLTKYGGRHVVTMLTGAPPGPKLMGFVKDVFKAAHVPVDFEEIVIPEDYEDATEMAEFEKLALMSIHRNGVGIKGNIVSTPTSITNVSLREELDLYVCVVHVKSYLNVRCRYQNVDIIFCRQNTAGEYAMLEYSAKPGIVESLKIITEENTTRFAEWCFEFALREGRQKVAIIHKANILKLSDGLFLKTVKDVARHYPKIQVKDMIVDHCANQLVQNPSQFDMIVTPNLYGNILSNIACGLIGGPGLMSGKNFGGSCALFEAGSRHLTYMDDDNLNPTAMLNASVDLLRHLEKHEHANVIHSAITKTLSEDQIHTHDIGGENTGEEIVESIKKNIGEIMKESKLKIF